MEVKDELVKQEENKVKKNPPKMSKIELIFSIVSIIFLVGFSVFYLSRAVIYKNKLTPTDDKGKKVSSLVNDIMQKKVVTSGDGLYQDGNKYFFKGEEVDNYVVYSNMLYRVIKINSDRSMEVISEDPINYLKVSEEIRDYKGSDIDRYLNEYFYEQIDKKNLIKGTVCLDTVEDINKITCNNKYYSNVKLLNISDFLNSKVDGNSFLMGEENTWLYNRTDEKTWLMNNSNLSLDAPDNLYAIRPVLTLTNVVSFSSGDGTKEKPYIIETDNIVGKYVKLGEDLWQVFETEEEKISLVLNNLIDDGNTKYQFNIKDNKFDIENVGIGKYLNTNYLESLSYKDLLLEHEYNIASYDDGLDKIKEDTIKVKVGLYDVTNILFNLELDNYYLITPTGNYSAYMFSDGVVYSNRGYVRSVRPTITISKEGLKGEGTLNNPYTKEVTE
ncbi:MAG: hypothetical protein PHU94_01600 [Bacilli bacterium]|nr:hypothetical protein [Bacilli bacterium]MDD4733706.1 hypothetical protein [Bacilli bacterium]